MGFEIDPEKARSNLRKYGVSFAHAEQALRDDLAVTIEDPDSINEQRFVTLGVDAFVDSWSLSTLSAASEPASSRRGKRAGAN